MIPGIALFGEVLMDLIVSPGFDSIVPVAGGSLYNTASSLAKLGVPCSFYSQVGKDLWGTRLLDIMTAQGLDISHIVQSARNKTMLAFAANDAAGNASYDFYRADAEESWDFADFGKHRFFHFGSIASIFPENQTALTEVLRLSEQTGAVISYDPNYRKPFSAFRSTTLSHMRRAHILKASIDDLEALFGISGIEAAFEKLEDFPAVLSVVTLGDKGAVALYRAGRHKPPIVAEVPAPSVKIIDTIGAGDNFSAGLLGYLYRNGIDNPQAIEGLYKEQVHEMLCFASSCAAVALGVPGADVPQSSMRELGKSLGSSAVRSEGSNPGVRFNPRRSASR